MMDAVQKHQEGLHAENGVLYAGEHKVLCAWESYSGWYWFATEKVEERKVSEGSGSVMEDGSIVDDTIWYGLVQGHEEEWGSWSMAEMKPLIKKGLVWPIKACDLPHSGRRNR